MTTRRHRVFLRVVVAQVFLGLAAAHGAGAKNLLWEVSSGTGKAYLMGSIHFGTPDMYPLAAPVNEAFEQSDALVVELDVLGLDPEKMARVVAKNGMYSDGSTLRAHIAPDTWDRLARTSDTLGIPIEFLQTHKPWLVAISLIALSLQRNGFSEALGVDVHFLKQAKPDKPIIELESLSQQMELFGDLSSEDQEKMLEQTLIDLEKGTEFFAEMLAVWKDGNGHALHELMTESFERVPEGEGLYEAIVSDRNVAMARKIQDMMQDGRTYFVVVGAAHLVGDQGIVQMFKQQGYRVTQH